MAYRWSAGKVDSGDINFSEDLDDHTKIDFEIDQIKLVANNVEYLTVTTGSNNVTVSGNLKVEGDDPRIKIDGVTNSHPGLEFYENGTRKWIIFNNYGDDSLDFKTNSNTRMVINQDGTVGIGTQSPSTTLDVAGDVNFDGSAVFNESSADKDFRVESNNATHMFYVDGGSNRLGIGTGSPQHTIDIQERSGVEAVLRIMGDSDVGIRLAADSDNSGENDNPYIDFYQDGQNSNSRNNRLASVAMEGDAAATFTDSIANAIFIDAFCPNAADSNLRPIQFANDSSNNGHKARITIEGTNGHVGIHTSTPSTEMEVIGTTKSDFFATDVTEQDLGSGTSSTLSTTSGLVLLDADSINGIDMGIGTEVHTLAFPTPSVSGQKLTIIAKNANTNNTMILPSGLISGSFSQLHDSSGISVLSFVWISVSGHAAWYQTDQV